VPYREIPDTMFGKPALCKWLMLEQKGNGSADRMDIFRMEYAVEVVRRKLRLEGRLKKAVSRKR